MGRETLYICSAFDTVDPREDTTPEMMREVVRRGGRAWFATWRDLGMRGPVAQVLARPVTAIPRDEPLLHVGPPERRPLADFDVVHLRTDPPIDVEYFYTTLILDATPRSTLVLNDPGAVRALNEKLAILRFPDLITDTLVTFDLDEAVAFVQAVGGRAIVKPLGECRSRGVQRLEGGPAAIRAALDPMVTAGAGQVMVQRYLPRVEEGETRAIVVDGEPRGWIGKVPATGGYLASVDHGATLRAHEPTARELHVASVVGAFLREQGVVFSALDIIDGFLSEVNVTSPGLLMQVDQLSGTHLAGDIEDAVERRLARRRA